MNIQIFIGRIYICYSYSFEIWLTNIFDIHIRSILEKRIYSYSYSVSKMIFVMLCRKVQYAVSGVHKPVVNMAKMSIVQAKLVSLGTHGEKIDNLKYLWITMRQIKVCPPSDNFPKPYESKTINTFFIYCNVKIG